MIIRTAEVVTNVPFDEMDCFDKPTFRYQSNVDEGIGDYAHVKAYLGQRTLGDSTLPRLRLS